MSTIKRMVSKKNIQTFIVIVFLLATSSAWVPALEDLGGVIHDLGFCPWHEGHS